MSAKPYRGSAKALPTESCNSILLKAGDAWQSDGLNRSSAEVSVMEMERRVQVIQ